MLRYKYVASLASAAGVAVPYTNELKAAHQQRCSGAVCGGGGSGTHPLRLRLDGQLRGGPIGRVARREPDVHLLRRSSSAGLDAAAGVAVVELAEATRARTGPEVGAEVHALLRVARRDSSGATAAALSPGPWIPCVRDVVCRFCEVGNLN